MSSTICQNFVQNAWKKELCSNCFKSKDEHVDRNRPKPIPVCNKQVEGIIKNREKTRPKRSVCFDKQLTEVIGFGGEDWCSDAENEEEDSDSNEEDFIAVSDDDETDRELQKITKANTDYNTLSLTDEGESKKSYSNLMLGKPIVDGDGKKKTLVVSVTPFGEDVSPSPRKITKVGNISKNKEILVETETSVILTSYTKNAEEETKKEEKSLLDEITETLENSKNPIQIISRKKIQKEIVLEVPKLECNKENINSVNKDTDKARTISEKRISLTRTPALKRDHEKPLIYQTSTAKIELMNNKNLQLNKDNVEKKNDEVNNNERSKEDQTEIKLSTLNKAVSCSVDNVSNLKLNPISIKLEKSIGSVPHIPTSIEKRIEMLESSKYHNMSFSQSRELAGEPDGRADPDNSNEPPALPLTPPPPLETQESFLHQSTCLLEKPKIPSKPTTVLIRKSIQNNHLMEAKNQILTTFSSNDKSVNEHKILGKQDSNGSDVASHVAGKRRAPMPPEETNMKYSPTKTDDVPQRSSCYAPMVRSEIIENMDQNYENVPEPIPRKSLSVSSDSLPLRINEERRKEKRGRFSLKKFLRMGSNKDLTKVGNDSSTNVEGEATIQPKPRLVIVHPTELDGAKVEVLNKSIDVPDYSNISTSSDCDIHQQLNNEYELFTSKASKPLPPARNLEDYADKAKPLLPPPPKSADLKNRQRPVPRKENPKETVYANIGEVRSSLVPNKPVRTASMREREAQQQMQQNYEPINIQNKKTSGENVYDYISNGRSSSPDSDSSREKNSPTSKTARLNKRSESSIDVSGEYFKFNNIPRSLSLTYCGSETESEIYAPYNFYGSESEVTEDDHDWMQNGRTHKLRSRKGRSIVHKNLEDNYGAVIVANHEALAQVLENIQQTVHIQPALRGLKALSNLRWSDFVIKPITPMIVGRRAFHQALWGTQPVTLCISSGAVPSSTLSVGTFNLIPVTEFSDLVSQKYLNHEGKSEKQIQVSVAVLPCFQVNTIQTYSDILRSKPVQSPEDTWKDALFILLQLVNALKTLQAQGIEELPLSLNTFVLCRDVEKETYHRLYVLQGLTEEITSKTSEESLGTLCMCALKALSVLQPATKITSLIQSLLTNERAVSLTQVKSVLEFSLWGPSDVALGSTIKERELALQRWLDLQRATVLHGLVCTRVQLTVYEECHLLFLVRSNARMMCDASLLLESSNIKHALTNGHK